MQDIQSMFNNIHRAEGLEKLNLTWKHRVGTIRQSLDSGDYSRGRSFYTSTYKCPKCGEFLYKAHAPVGFKADDGKNISAKNIFACFDCQNLFAVEAWSKLGGGEYYIMDDTRMFNPAIQIIDSTAISISQLMGF